MTGFAGGHSGAWLRELIGTEGIEDALVETSAPLHLGFMASSPHSHHPTTVLPNGFPVKRAESRALLERVNELLGAVKLVIASGSVSDPMIDDVYLDLWALCKQCSIPC